MRLDNDLSNRPPRGPIGRSLLDLNAAFAQFAASLKDNAEGAT